jgi:hypothetical protein
MKAFAEPLPDNPDNEPESSIELVREPDVPEVGASSAQRSGWTYVFSVSRPTHRGLRLHRRSEPGHFHSFLCLTFSPILPAISGSGNSYRA